MGEGEGEGEGEGGGEPLGLGVYVSTPRSVTRGLPESLWRYLVRRSQVRVR